MAEEVLVSERVLNAAKRWYQDVSDRDGDFSAYFVGIGHGVTAARMYPNVTLGWTTILIDDRDGRVIKILRS